MLHRLILFWGGGGWGWGGIFLSPDIIQKYILRHRETILIVGKQNPVRLSRYTLVIRKQLLIATHRYLFAKFSIFDTPGKKFVGNSATILIFIPWGCRHWAYILPFYKRYWHLIPAAGNLQMYVLCMRHSTPVVKCPGRDGKSIQIQQRSGTMILYSLVFRMIRCIWHDLEIKFVCNIDWICQRNQGTVVFSMA